MQRLLAITIGVLLHFCFLSSQEETLFHYTVDDGLPSSNVYYGIQDSQGYIWLGTDKGLSRFDGYEFKTYTVVDGLPFNDVWRMVEDSKGRIWLATFGPDFYYFQNDTFVRIENPHKGFKGLAIHDFTEDQKGNIWIRVQNPGSTFSPVFRYDGEKVSKIDYIKYRGDVEEIGEPSKDFLILSGGICTINNDSCLLYRSVTFLNSPLTNFRLKNYVSINNFHSLDTSVHCYDNHLYISIKDSLIDIELPIEHCTGTPKSIMGTEAYIFQCDTSILALDQNFKLTNKYDFLNKFNTRRVFFDNQKNLWITTDDEGLFMRPSNSIYTKNYTRKEEKFVITSLNKTLDGILWIGTEEGQIFRLEENQKLVALNEFLGEPKEDLPKVMDIHYSLSENKLYFLYKDLYFRGLNLDDPREKKEIAYEIYNRYNEVSRRTTKKYIESGKLTSLKSFGQQEYGDTLWIQSSYGLVTWSKREALYELRLCIPGRGYALAFKNERVWLGQTKGLFLYANGQIDSLQDLKDRYPILNKNIIELGIDSRDNLWIGTDGYGVFRLKDQKLDTITALKNTIVKELFVDEQDQVWVASNQGLYHIENEENVRLYTTADGLGSNEVNCAYVDSNKIYVGTNKGLTIIDRNQFSKENKSPLFHIQGIAIRGEEQEIIPNQSVYNFELNHDENSIKVDYVCLSYESSENIIYEYKLSGIDKNWKQTKQLTKEYPILPYGESYTLQLRAKDINQEYSQDVYTLNFNIKPPWWQTWWFRLLVLAVIGIFIYYRINAFKTKEKEKIAINKRFAELELQALQSQMNPHFIFNALQAIQDFVVGKDERAANKYMSNFAKLMRLYLESSKEKYISLEEELQLLELYMDLEQLRFEPPFDYELDCPDSIDWGAVRIPSMLLQPFVENSINHGLKYKKGKGFVKIEIQEEKEDLLIRIIDNGVGIAKAKEIKQKATKSYKSRGMKITEERLKTIQFVDSVRIGIEVQDRLIEGQVKGTIVEIKCPFFEKI